MIFSPSSKKLLNSSYAIILKANRMTKEWFPHDYGTRHKQKMAVLLHEQKPRGYGLFWIIVEMLYEGSDKWMGLDEITYIAIEKESGEPAEDVKEFINKCINRYKVFKRKGSRFTTERVLSNIDDRLELSKKRSEAGRRSGEARREKGSNDEHLLNKDEHLFDNGEQKGTEERKGDKKKGKNYLRPKGLTASFEADPAEIRELKKEYDQLVDTLPDKENIEIWNNVKGFITDKKPTFLEPYIDLWNIFALTQKLILRPIHITDHRRKKLETRVREPGFDFVAVLQEVKKSNFLQGKNDRQWTVDFEFIVHSEENYTKILEGKYK